MASDLAVIASRRFMWATVVLLAVLCAASLDVPQVPDGLILSDYPLSVGPFITTLALNALGHSIPLWLLLFFLVMHKVASRQGPGLKDALPGLVPMVLLLVFGGHAGRPTAPEPGMLSVSIPQADGTRADLVVREGKPLSVQGKTLVFGLSDSGPYAVELDEGGHLRAHIQAEGRLPRPAIEVASRRPSIRPKPLLPDWADHLLSILVACAALWLLLSHPVRTAPAALLFLGAVLAASPFTGPGTAHFVLSSGTSTAHHLMEMAGPEDVGSYLAMVLATTTLWLPHTLTLVGGVAACAGLLAWWLAPARRLLWLFVMAAGLTWALAAAVVALYAVFRIPLGLTEHDLAATFERDILPRLPMELSMLAHRVDPPGPYTIPLLPGLATAIALAAPALALFVRPASRTSERPRLLAPVVLASLLVLRAILCATALPEGAPAAVVPVSLVAAVVTGLAFRDPDLRTIAAGMALLTVG